MVLEIEVQGATQVRAAKPDSVQIFIAPPDPEGPARAARRPWHRLRRGIDKRLETAEIELASQGDFDHRVVNDDLDQAAQELVGIVRTELGRPLDSP